jgi:transcriptional regulator with XRE-family HTH domain
MIRIDTPADLAEALGLLRRLGGHTQTAVGIELGTTPQRIGDYERGRIAPNSPTLMRLLAALGYRLEIVPVIETAPETGLSATETAETPSVGIPGGSEGSQGGSGAPEGDGGWHWIPTAGGGFYSGPHGPDICPNVGCQHEGGAA